MDWTRLRRRARVVYLKLLRLQGRPEQIAGGVALGIFLGFVLPPGTQTIVALGMAPILRCNPIAAAAAVWVTNPFTMPLIYPMAAALGTLVTGMPIREAIPADEDRVWAFLFNFRAHSRLVVNMTIGLMMMGAVGSFITYYVTRMLLAFRPSRRRRPRPPQDES